MEDSRFLSLLESAGVFTAGVVGGFISALGSAYLGAGGFCTAPSPIGLVITPILLILFAVIVAFAMKTKKKSRTRMHLVLFVVPLLLIWVALIVLPGLHPGC